MTQGTCSLRLVLFAGLAGGILASGCGEEDPVETPLDTGSDTADAGGDATADTTPDATPDARPDATPDTTPDATPDTTPDTTPDAEEDTGPTACEAACAAVVSCPASPSACADVASSIGAQCATLCAADEAGVVALVDADCEAAAALFAFAAGEGDACSAAPCTRPSSDYTPGADDEWAACVSDGGEYVRVEETVSTIARIEAFERIGDLLWWADAVPNGEAFISARTEYSVDEGLQSRVTRREDEHYPPVSDGMGGTLRCRDEGVPELDPERCTGPALIEPIMLDAFQQGIAGTDAAIQSARVEGALLWFLLISPHKEARTCATAKRDCDSAWAYYTGGNQRDGGIGLAGYLRALSPMAHDYAFDGALAVRCWRDLDGADVATDLEMRDRAVAQYDRAILYGFARIVVDRLLQWHAAVEADRAPLAAFLDVAGQALSRELVARDATLGAALVSALDADNLASSDALATAAGILDLFPCP